ncbi:hypothetical protein GCM10009422_15450 [Brevundimonas kwangchunensis]|uniref:Prepilin type IV endopeptidase peptidase domain-containing protein n=1 Tax=Brevundimonas kwangchunensis TaxID=322163 RepID=A0ABP3RXX3_9CAUL
MTAYTLTTGLVLTGALIGPVTAWISVWLPQKGRPGIRRIAALAIAAAMVGGWSALALPAPVAALLTALLGWQLLLLAVVDGENFWLPDILTWTLAVSGVLAAVILQDRGIADAIIGAVAGFAGLWLLAFVYRKTRGRQGLGGGDPFMLAGAGAWVGWIGLPSVLLWAAVGGLSLVVARALTGRKVSGTDRLPFGVFLAIGLWLTWLLGPIGLWR